VNNNQAGGRRGAAFKGRPSLVSTDLRLLESAVLGLGSGVTGLTLFPGGMNDDEDRLGLLVRVKRALTPCDESHEK
jgi:hypothetical protein